MFFSYASTGALTGQVPAQAPQEMQAASSITYFPSPSEIAFTGHSAAHAPHEMHSSEILYAILTAPPLESYSERRCLSSYPNCNIFSEKIKCFFMVRFFSLKFGIKALNQEKNFADNFSVTFVIGTYRASIRKKFPTP